MAAASDDARGGDPRVDSPTMRSSGTASVQTASAKGSGRRIAFTVATFIFGSAANGALFGVGLVIGWFDTEDGGIHRVHDLAFGILYGLILSVAFYAMVRRPEAKPSVFLQVVVIAVAALIAGVISADVSYLIIGPIVGAAAAILLALHPARVEVLHPGPKPSLVMGALVLVESVPLVWFGLTMAGLQRQGVAADPHVSMDHWANMAAMAFGLLLTGLLASARIRGWRLTAWCAGLGTITYGLASIVFHNYPGTHLAYPGSEGVGWGVAASIGGLAFIAAAEWESARLRPTG